MTQMPRSQAEPHTAARLQQGSALVVTLALLLILAATAAAAAQNVVANLRVTTSMQRADRAFALAANAVDTAFDYAQQHPHRLSANVAISMPPQTSAYGNAAATIEHVQTGSCAAPWAGQRLDFMLSATAIAGQGASSHQRMLFSVCRELCEQQPCGETSPQAYSWFVTRSDYAFDSG